MRAKEFTANIPITIKLGDFELDGTEISSEPVELPDDAKDIIDKTDEDTELGTEDKKFISPQQQEIELKKAELAKEAGL